MSQVQVSLAWAQVPVRIRPWSLPLFLVPLRSDPASILQDFTGASFDELGAVIGALCTHLGPVDCLSLSCTRKSMGRAASPSMFPVPAITSGLQACENGCLLSIHWSNGSHFQILALRPAATTLGGPRFVLRDLGTYIQVPLLEAIKHFPHHLSAGQVVEVCFQMLTLGAQLTEVRQVYVLDGFPSIDDRDGHQTDLRDFLPN